MSNKNKLKTTKKWRKEANAFFDKMDNDYEMTMDSAFFIGKNIIDEK